MKGYTYYRNCSPFLIVVKLSRKFCPCIKGYIIENSTMLGCQFLYIPYSSMGSTKTTKRGTCLYKWIYLLQTMYYSTVLMSLLVLLCIGSQQVLAFNVDTENAIVHSGQSGSKFGFTVQQFIDEENHW